MPILDKNLLLAEIEERLNNYIPANTTRQIINDAAEVMTRYEVTRLKPDDGSPVFLIEKQKVDSAPTIIPAEEGE